jgi:hypothetical protein
MAMVGSSVEKTAPPSKAKFAVSIQPVRMIAGCPRTKTAPPEESAKFDDSVQSVTVTDDLLPARGRHRAAHCVDGRIDTESSTIIRRVRDHRAVRYGDGGVA